MGLGEEAVLRIRVDGVGDYIRIWVSRIVLKAVHILPCFCEVDPC